MLFTRRATIHACLLAVLALGIFAPAAAGQRKTAPQAEASPAKETERDAELTVEQQRIDRELQRELLRTREQIMREALNRARFGRETGLERETLRFVGPFLVFLAILLSLLWVLRTLLETRRWNRAAAVQAEMHKNLLERFASSQELLAYMESEAGRRFLEATPIQVEQAARTPFPYGRILWSVQVGVILAVAGAGLLFLQDRVPGGAVGFLVFGVLALAVGAGFLFSGLISYILSKSFGLLEPVSRPAGARSDLTAGPP